MKSITIPYNDKEYTLTFNRRTVSALEQEGFKVTEVQNNLVTYVPMLFDAAFRAKHPKVQSKVVDEIYEKISDKEGLFDKLIEIYSDVLDSLFEEPEADEGNIEWKASW